MIYAFTHIEAMKLLAASVLDYLDETFTEGQLDDDSNPPHTALYNLAHSVLGRQDSQDALEHSNVELTTLVQYRTDSGYAKVVWEGIRRAEP